MLILCFNISEIEAWGIMSWKFRMLFGEERVLFHPFGFPGWSNEHNIN